MKENAFTKSVSSFKKQWKILTIYQMISAIVITSFSWFFISQVRKKMETVSDLQPVLHDTLNAIEQNDIIKHVTIIRIGDKAEAFNAVDVFNNKIKEFKIFRAFSVVSIK